MGAVADSRMFRQRYVTLGLAVSLGAALAAGPAFGQSSSWNVDADGTWTTAANWLNSTQARGNGNTATFSNDITANRTVTLDETRALGNLVFGDADPTTAASWDLTTSGTPVLTINNLANTGVITVNSLGTNATATISLLLGSSNTPTIEKNGSGTLVLSNVGNNFTAKLAITAGTLQVSADRNLGGDPGTFAADQITLSNGATLRTTAGFTLSSSRGITVGAGGGTLNLNGGLMTYAGRFTGPGQTLTTAGVSGLTLSNSTGTATDVNWDLTGSGTRIFFQNNNALGTGSVRVRNNVRLVSDFGGITVGNAITLDNGGGLAARSGGATFSSVAFPSTGTVVLNKDDPRTYGLTISSGGALTGNLTFDTSQGATNPVGDVTLSGVFSGASGGITKSGTGASGRLILDGINTYGGNTTISTGTLAIGANGSIASSSAISVASGATFDVSAVTGGFSLGASQVLSGSGSVLGNVTALGTIAPGTSPGTLSFGSNLALDSGSILSYELDGADTTVGSGVNDLSSVTGDLTLDGTLNVTELGAGSFLSATQGDSWRLVDYTGTLIDNTLSLGTMPSLSPGLTFGIDTTTAGQVNLVVVPEPAAMLAVVGGLGLAGLAAGRRRRRGKTVASGLSFP